MQGKGDNLVRLSVYKQEQKFLEFLHEPASTVIRIYKEVIKYRTAKYNKMADSAISRKNVYCVIEL